MGSSRSCRTKDRERKAAAQRLTPIRGQAGRRLRHSGLRSGRVVGLSQFAQGIERTRSSRPRNRVASWALAALPMAIVIIWVVARMTRHL